MRRTALLLAAVPTLALAQATAPATSAGTHAPPSGAGDKVICKRFTEIGSLVASKKVCKPKAEWDAESSDAQKRLSDCTNGGGATGARCG